MIQAIVTDIGGTTSSFSFATEGLYPYVRAHLPGFMRERSADPEVQQALAEIDRHAGHVLTVEETIAQLPAWMDEDRKITPLKTLQGLSGSAAMRATRSRATSTPTWRRNSRRGRRATSGCTFTLPARSSPSA